MYCICSNRSFDDILSQQRADPLPLNEMITSYTSCTSGCGSCIKALLAEAEISGLDPIAVSKLSVQEA